MTFKNKSHFIFLVSLQEIIQENPSPKLRWEFKAANCLWPIPFTGSPYIHLGMQEYHCHHGKDLNLKQKKVKKMESEDDICKKSRKVLQPTKKEGCPVKFIVKKVFRFLDYNLKSDARRSRKKMLDDIRLNEFSLDNYQNRCGIESFCTGNIVQYLVVMPSKEHHHMNNNDSNGYRLDKRVKEFIITQIQQGNTRPKDIELKIEDFVCNNLFQGGLVPEQYRDMFFPSRKKISNIKIAFNKYSRIFQENLDNLVDDWTRFSNEELLGSSKVIHDVDAELVTAMDDDNDEVIIDVDETIINDGRIIIDDNRTIIGNQMIINNNEIVIDNDNRIIIHDENEVNGDIETIIDDANGTIVDDDNGTIIDVCDNTETTVKETTANILCDPVVEIHDDPINNVHFSVEIPAINYDCCYFTNDRLNIAAEQQIMMEKNFLEEKKMSIRATLQQFMDMTEISSDYKTLDDLDSTLITCLSKLRMSLNG